MRHNGPRSRHDLGQCRETDPRLINPKACSLGMVKDILKLYCYCRHSCTISFVVLAISRHRELCPLFTTNEFQHGLYLIHIGIADHEIFE
jgi:hypothetical protein